MSLGISGFVDADTIEGAIECGVTVRPPLSGMTYYAFVDPSGGRSDSMTMALCHREKNNQIVLDCLCERKAPFAPTEVVAEFSAVMKEYRVHSCTADRYAGEWPTEAFKKHGVKCEPADKNRSELYLDFLPLLNSGRVALLDNRRMVSQFVGLERRTSRGGRDTVDHSPGSHDDLCNSVAGAAVKAAGRKGPMIVSPEAVELSRRGAGIRARMQRAAGRQWQS